MNAEPGYRILASVLNDALNQAQHGKGKERHAAGESFDKQEICQNTRAVGFGYPLGQARKKAREAKRLLRDRGKDAAIAECLGAINYLAAAVIVMEEQEQAETDEIFERAAAETWNRDDDMILGDHSERTAAQGVEDTLRFRQNKHEYLRAASKILDTPPRQPSLAGLVDWSDAPDWAVCAAQDKNGDIYFFSTNEVMLNSYHPHKYEWANITGRAAFYKTAPLAHDWQTPLKRTTSGMKICPLCDGDGLREYWTTRGGPGREKLVKEHTTCEWCKGKKQVPYWVECTADAKKWHEDNYHHQSFTDEEPQYLMRHIPVTEQEDEAWESKAPSDVPG